MSVLLDFQSMCSSADMENVLKRVSSGINMLSFFSCCAKQTWVLLHAISFLFFLPVWCNSCDGKPLFCYFLCVRQTPTPCNLKHLILTLNYKPVNSAKWMNSHRFWCRTSKVHCMYRKKCWCVICRRIRKTKCITKMVLLTLLYSFMSAN